MYSLSLWYTYCLVFVTSFSSKYSSKYSVSSTRRLHMRTPRNIKRESLSLKGIIPSLNFLTNFSGSGWYLSAQLESFLTFITQREDSRGSRFFHRVRCWFWWCLGSSFHSSNSCTRQCRTVALFPFFLVFENNADVKLISLFDLISQVKKRNKWPYFLVYAINAETVYVCNCTVAASASLLKFYAIVM